MRSSDFKKIKEDIATAAGSSAGQAVQPIQARGATSAMSPVELQQKKKDLELAANNPNTKLSIPSDTGHSEVRDFEGIIDDPDDPRNVQIAVMGDREGELDVLNLEDADLLEDIMKLSGIKTGVKK